MALNVTTAAIASGANTAIAQPSLAQWDQGQILKIEGVELPESYQVEFSGGGTVRTVPMIGTAEGVQIPNKLLQSSHPITAHVVLHESATDRETEYWITIYVKPRQAPETVEIDPADISIIDQTIAAAQQAVATSTAQAEAAAGSAESAAASAEAATASETAAAGSASSAASSERSAGASAVEAGQAKTAAETAQGAAEAAQAAAEQAVTDAQAAGSQAVEAIDEAKTAGIQAIDAEAATQINQVGRAGATQIRQINELASNQMRSIETKTTQSIGAIEDARDAAIEDVQTEGQTQTAAAQAQAQAAASSASAAANSASAAAGSASAAATARTGAETAAASVSASAAQIAQNASDIADLNRQISDYAEILIDTVDDVNINSGLVLLQVSLGDSVTIKRTDGLAFTKIDQLRFYDSEKVYIDYWTVAPAYGSARTFNYTGVAKNATYIGITNADGGATVVNYTVINNTRHSVQTELDILETNVNDQIEALSQQMAQKEIINRFDKSKITAGKYIYSSDGRLGDNADFFASDFIYIGDLDTVTVSYTHIFGWYDASKAWLGHPDTMNSRTTDLTFTRPENAAYLRFSSYNGDINKSQVGADISRENYTPYGVYVLPDLRINTSQISGDAAGIVVDASGGGDYTSFTQAIYETVDSGVDIFVKPGTYDIVAEYISLFGQEAVDSMADADSAIFNGFQYGVRLRKRKVEFAPGAHLVCDWTGHTVDGTHRFSALGVDYNVEIIGLDLDVTATFYCIHDDYGIETPYTVKYENCRVVGHNITNANCIGGGCKKYSRHILNNCYFDNNLTGSATVRYHNTNAEGAEPEIYVSNCYFNNWFTPRWYGTQTTKMKVYVNNCEARAIYKMAESSSYNVDNVDLYKWCNTETAPQS